MTLLLSEQMSDTDKTHPPPGPWLRTSGRFHPHRFCGYDGKSVFSYQSQKTFRIFTLDLQSLKQLFSSVFGVCFQPLEVACQLLNLISCMVCEILDGSYWFFGSIAELSDTCIAGLKLKGIKQK
jgi:hypothetical protein